MTKRTFLTINKDFTLLWQAWRSHFFNNFVYTCELKNLQHRLIWIGRTQFSSQSSYWLDWVNVRPSRTARKLKTVFLNVIYSAHVGLESKLNIYPSPVFRFVAVTIFSGITLPTIKPTCMYPSIYRNTLIANSSLRHEEWTLDGCKT